MDRSDLAKRMKDYESISKTKLMKRCPVICRIDGKAHHSFTRGFKRPFDEIYIKSMQETAKYLCENIQGVVLSYQQSDEITIVLVDYEKLNTSPYFDYEVQKLCSIIASMATMAFNEAFQRIYANLYMGANEEDKIILYNTYGKKCFKAMFDCRVFNIPKEEVTNCIYWRQLDASRNSVQMVGQANFSHKELQNKSCNKIQDILMTQKGINWNDLPTYQKRGSCCIKEEYQDEDVDIKDGVCMRTRWIIDKDIPIFRNEGREYIEKLIMVGE
jgi:tRNA(His) 5'-end guanylyltransferase